jgi:hypothetical protein
MRTRRMTIGGLATIAALMAGGALFFAPASTEGTTNNGLEASVVPSNRGPLRLCPSGCNGGNFTWNFVYVTNKNDLTNTVVSPSQFRRRDTLQNAFVVTSVDQSIFVDGEHYQDDTFTPPPHPNVPSYSGHFPSTVTCESTTGPLDPCNDVHDVAVVPGEKAAVAFLGWGHVAGEPNGKYVFVYTVHGSLNGTPVDITTRTHPITMTD